MAELLASAAAASAGTAATTATAASTAFSILQGVASVAAIAGTLSAAQGEARAFEASAVQTDLESGQQQLSSQQRQTEMKRELMRVLGENDVAIASAGIDLRGGVAENARAKARDDAARQLSIERDDADMRKSLMRLRASGLRTRASEARTGGLFRAAGQAAGFAADLSERG